MLSWLTSWIKGKDSQADGRFIKCEATIKCEGPKTFDLAVARVFADGERELEAESDEPALPEEYTVPILPESNLRIKGSSQSRQILWSHKGEKFRLDLAEDTQLAAYEAFVVALGKAYYIVLHGEEPEGEEATYNSLVQLFTAPQKQPSEAPQETTPAAAAAAAAMPEEKKPQDEELSTTSMYPTLEASPVKKAPLPKTPAQQISASEFAKTMSKEQLEAAAAALPPRLAVSSLSGTTVANAPCILQAYNTHTQSYDMMCASCQIVITQVAQFEFMLGVLDTTANPEAAQDAPVLIGQKLCNEMNPSFEMETRSITWIYSLGSKTWAWRAVLADEKQDLAFKNFFSRCLFEATSKTPFDKVKEEDQNALLNTMRGEKPDDSGEEEAEETEEDKEVLEAMKALSLKALASKTKAHERAHDDDDDDVGDYEDERERQARLEDEEEEEEDEEDEDEEEEEEDEEAEQEEDEERPLRRVYRQGPKNRLLNVAAKHHRALVCRGRKIGVFTAEDRERGLNFETCISGMTDTKGDPFVPRRAMLHGGEDHMLMLHTHDRKRVLDMDLNRGEMVQEWNAGDYQIDEIVPQSKFAPCTQAQAVLGANCTGFFLMDARLPSDNKIVVDKKYMAVSRAPLFSCCATTANGDIVMGTQTGQVRLYDGKLLVQGRKETAAGDRLPPAKTTFLGLGDPVLGIDVTQDGAWVVATCATYLMLIRAVDDSGRCGYKKSLGDSKEIIYLRLQPQHLVRVGGKVSFTPAKFDMGSVAEKSIVTSTGNYVVTWNFEKATRKQTNFYRIVSLDSTVVADQFRFGDSNTVVVAMPDDVTVARNVLPTRRRS